MKDQNCTTRKTAPAIHPEIVRKYIAACTAAYPMDDAAVEAFRCAESDLIDATAEATGIDAASIATYGTFTPETGTLRLTGEGDHDVLRILADGRIIPYTGAAHTTLTLDLPAETAAALAALCVRPGYPDRTLEQVALDLIEQGLWAEGAQ